MSNLSGRLPVRPSQLDIDTRETMKALSDGRLFRFRDFKKLGINQTSIKSMLKDGVIEKLSTGFYELNSDLIVNFNYDNSKIDGLGVLEEFQDALMHVKNGYVCLISAAIFHNITVETTSKTWICIPHGSYIPKNKEDLPVRFFISRKKDLSSVGMDSYNFRGSVLKITDLERTVVDIYKHCSKIGDISLPRKVLDEVLIREDFSRSKLSEYAKKIGVWANIRSDVELFDMIKSQNPAANEGQLRLEEILKPRG